jgi:hypothetical protein
LLHVEQDYVAARKFDLRKLDEGDHSREREEMFVGGGGIQGGHKPSGLSRMTTLPEAAQQLDQDLADARSRGEPKKLL